jgi:hypothetical protein
MFYYLMLAFLIFVAFAAHVILAHLAHSLLEEFDSTGWYRYKPKYKKYLLIPGLPEVILAILILMICGVIIYSCVISLFED